MLFIACLSGTGWGGILPRTPNPKAGPRPAWPAHRTRLGSAATRRCGITSPRAPTVRHIRAAVAVARSPQPPPHPLGQRSTSTPPDLQSPDQKAHPSIDRPAIDLTSRRATHTCPFPPALPVNLRATRCHYPASGQRVSKPASPYLPTLLPRQLHPSLPFPQGQREKQRDATSTGQGAKARAG